MIFSCGKEWIICSTYNIEYCPFDQPFATSGSRPAKWGVSDILNEFILKLPTVSIVNCRFFTLFAFTKFPICCYTYVLQNYHTCRIIDKQRKSFKIDFSKLKYDSMDHRASLKNIDSRSSSWRKTSVPDTIFGRLHTNKPKMSFFEVTFPN